MHSVFTISKREVTRLRTRFKGKSRVSIFAIILLAALLCYVIYQQDIGISKDLYSVGVSPDGPQIVDERFDVKVLDRDTGYYELWEENIDVYVDGNDISYLKRNKRALYAVGALDQYLEKQELIRISEEYSDEIDKAFPLRIEVRHMKVDRETDEGEESGSLTDVLQPEETIEVQEPVLEPEPPPVSEPDLADIPEPSFPVTADPNPDYVSVPDSGTVPEREPSTSDDALRDQLEDFKNDSGMPRFKAEFVSDEEIIIPSLMTPPIPFAQVLIAFLYIIPIFMVSVFFTSSFMEEKIDRKLVVLLSAPVTPFQVIIGKMLPYLGYSLVTIVVITLVLGGDILLSLAIFTPVMMFILCVLLMVALLYRTFKDQTFFSVLAAWFIIAYLVTPAMFAGVSDISFASPLTLAVKMYRGESFSLAQYFLSTIPMYLIFAITMYVAVRIFNEEYLMGFRPLHRKLAEAVYLVMDKYHLNWSVVCLTLSLIPLILMIQLASIVVAQNLPGTYAPIIAIFVLAIVSEEIAKSVPIAVLLQTNSIHTRRSVVKFSFLSAFGFFLGEKLLMYLMLSVISRSLFIDALYGAGLLPMVLAIHFVTTSVVCLVVYRFGLKYYPLAIAAGAIIHAGYNLIWIWGEVF